MDLDHIKYFKWILAFRAVAETGTMTAAAHKLGVSQAAISNFVQHLEKQMNAELFIRRNPTLVLSARGEQLYQDSSELVEFFKQRCQTLTNESKASYQGTIFIATTHSFAACCLPKYIKNFYASNPLIDFSIISGTDSRNIIGSVRRNDVDFGITSIDIVPDNITADLLHSTHLVLIAPKSFSFSINKLNFLTNLNELQDVQFIISDNGIHINKYISTYLIEKGIFPKRFITISNYGDVRAMVRAGLGCAIVENFEINNDEWYNVYRLPHASWVSNYYIVRRKRKYISQQALAFINSIIDEKRLDA